MKTKDFDFYLPDELIAQVPLENRDHSRLLCMNKETGDVQHKNFYNIVDYLKPGDCLVLNNSRVLPSRIYGKKDTGARVEFLLLKPLEDRVWETLVKPGRKAKIGHKFTFGEGLMRGEIIGYGEGGIRHIKLDYKGVLNEVLYEIGTMPLPPYITEELEEQERYQTVYSKEHGSAAAPTAGLHFTDGLLNELKEKGVRIAHVTLHVGLGTFRPVNVDDINEHTMHSETYMLDDENAKIINLAKAEGGKVYAVGTTSVRTLESIYKKHGAIVSDSDSTDIFIYPGYEFRTIDGLITNFHLPESTLIMLVSAFSSKENVLNAYSIAVEEKYRFFSFGDAMLLY